MLLLDVQKPFTAVVRTVKLWYVLGAAVWADLILPQRSTSSYKVSVKSLQPFTPGFLCDTLMRHRAETLILPSRGQNYSGKYLTRELKGKSLHTK